MAPKARRLGPGALPTRGARRPPAGGRRRWPWARRAPPRVLAGAEA